MDATIISTALITISRHFNNYVDSQWVVLSYLLVYLGTALLFARLSDVVGRKWSTIVALVLVMGFSLGGGLAQSMSQVIVFRALQGLGGSGLYTMAFLTFPEVTPPEYFASMGALPGLIYAVSAILGPVIGGVFTTNVTWRWIFYFNVPYCAAVIILILLCWPKVDSPGSMKWHEMDFIGALLFTVAPVLLVFALQEGGSGVYKWGSGLIVTCLTVAGVTAVFLVFWIHYLSKPTRPWSKFKPFFHESIITHRVMLANFISSISHGWVFFSVLIMLPARFQIVDFKSAQTSGFDLLALTGGAAVGSITAGIFAVKLNQASVTGIAGTAFMVLGTGLLSSITYSSDGLGIPARLLGFEVILGWGIGTIIAINTIIIKLYAKIDHAAAAQGLISYTRVLGGNLGLAINTIVLNRTLVNGLKDVLSPEQLAQLQQSLNVVATFDGPQVLAVGRVFAQGFQRIFQISTGIAGLGFIAMCFTYDHNPPKVTDMQMQEVDDAPPDIEPPLRENV